MDKYHERQSYFLPDREMIKLLINRIEKKIDLPSLTKVINNELDI